METGGGKREEAQDKELERLGGAGSPVIDEQPNREIEKTDAVLVVDGGITGRRLYEDVALLKFDPRSAQRVVCRPERYAIGEGDLPERLRNVERFSYREALNLNEFIAEADSRFITGAAGGNVAGDNLVSSPRTLVVYPGHAIVVEGIGAQMLKAENGSYDSGGRADQQQSTCELVP